MKEPSFNADRLGKESGQATILIALSIPVFLILMGLAIDSGYLYLMRSKLQRAVDAATISGIDLVSRGFTDSEVDAHATEMGIVNAELAGISQSQLNQFEVTVQTDLATRITTVTADASFNADVILLRLIPGLVTKQVRAVAAAERIPVLISLVLDFSSSMSDECSPTGCARTKLDDLKDAAIAFINQFSSKDQIALITFNEVATVNYDIKNLNKNDLEIEIRNIPPPSFSTGATNIPEGLELGREEIENVIVTLGGGATNYAKALVLFTDGAPNVFRADFFNPKVVCAASDPLCTFPPTNGSQYDYYLWTVGGAEKFFPPGDPQKLYSPSPSCGPANLDGYFYITNDCVANLGYHEYSHPLTTHGTYITDSGAQVEEVLHQPYLFSIVESDYAKTGLDNNATTSADNITVYTVGLGREPNSCPPATPCCTSPPFFCGSCDCFSPADPYQNVWDLGNVYVKTVFLRRIANDPAVRRLNDPEFTNDPGYLNLARNPNYPRGASLITPNADELRDVFLEIARRIKQRLVQ